MDRVDSLPTPPERGGSFATTQWSVVLAAGQTNSSAAAPALERLFERYWYPLYVFVRRRGHSAEDSFDLTQGFLTGLLERNFLGAADPSRGRFRSFLLTAFDRYLINEWKRSTRQKRGGGRRPLSFDVEDLETRYRLEPVDARTPESIFERRWALTLLEVAASRLGDECRASGRGALFEAVRSILAGEPEASGYAEIAARLGISEGALKTTIHRLRRRYGEILRTEILATIGDPSELDDEIRHLFAVLGSGSTATDSDPRPQQNGRDA
jgi:RNA polymerase sigma factor (sigma-70 family)